MSFTHLRATGMLNHLFAHPDGVAASFVDAALHIWTVTRGAPVTPACVARLPVPPPPATIPATIPAAIGTDPTLSFPAATFAVVADGKGGLFLFARFRRFWLVLMTWLLFSFLGTTTAKIHGPQRSCVARKVLAVAL
jgi:hypothetical protein